MTPIECDFEAEVLSAVVQSRWPERTDPALRAHVAKCEICSDVAAVAAALDESSSAMRITAVVPDSGRVWWLAQMRARREAARTAGRPITAAQVLAFASAMGVLGACFGATSAWFQGAFQEALQWIRVSILTEHTVLAILAAALVLAVPGAVYWVVLRD